MMTKQRSLILQLSQFLLSRKIVFYINLIRTGAKKCIGVDIFYMDKNIIESNRNPQNTPACGK